MKYFILITIFVGSLVTVFFVGKKTEYSRIANVIEADTVLVSIDTPEPIAELEPEIIYRDTGSHTIKIQPVLKDTVIFIPVPIKVDTAEILKDYFTIRQYQVDTTINEVYSNVGISIYANKLANVQLQSTLISPPVRQRFKYSVAIVGGYREMSPIFYLGKNDIELGLGYNLTSKGKGLRFAASWQLR